MREREREIEKEGARGNRGLEKQSEWILNDGYSLFITSSSI